MIRSHSVSDAERRVQAQQSNVLSMLAALEDDQAELDNAANWLPDADAKLVRNVAERVRYVICDLRSIEKILAEANKNRRLRSEAARQPAVAEV